MIWQEYKLEDKILKTNEITTLWKTENGMIDIDKGTLAVPIKLDDQRKGYVFHGRGKLVLDTIVETERGAVGKSVEKELNEPFLMLGENEETQQHFSSAAREDLRTMGYESEKDFVTKAEGLLDRFIGKRLMHEHSCCRNTHGLIFAFPNKADKLDTLIVDGSKIVYKATDKVFLSSKNRVILKTPEEVVLSSDRHSLAFKCRHSHCC